MEWWFHSACYTQGPLQLGDVKSVNHIILRKGWMENGEVFIRGLALLELRVEGIISDTALLERCI